MVLLSKLAICAIILFSIFILSYMLFYFVERNTEKIDLKYDGRMLSVVKNKTPELCWIALKSHHEALIHIPAEIQTAEMCLYALEQSWSKIIFYHIKIPIEGDFLKKVNRMKLLYGPLK